MGTPAGSRGPQALPTGFGRQLCTEKVLEFVELNLSVDRARARSILAEGKGGRLINWKRMEMQKRGLWTLGSPGPSGQETSLLCGPRACVGK